MLDYLQRLSWKVVNYVNPQAKMDAQARAALFPRTLRKSLIENAHFAAERDLACGFLSEISARLPGDKFAINTQGSWLAQLNEEDFALIPIHKEKIPSSYSAARHAHWHRIIYSMGDATSVFLGHPAAAVSLAALGTPPLPQFLIDAKDAIGSVACCAPDDEMIRKLAPVHQALLIEGHGLLTWGKSIHHTLAVAEMVNLWCDLTLTHIKTTTGCK